MIRVKRQHFVPRFYLKKFTHRGLQLFAYDKQGDRTFPTSVDNIASEGYFYDIPQAADLENADTQIVEKGLSELEAVFSETLTEVLKTIQKKKRLRPSQRPILAHFIAIQLLRTKEHRAELQQLMETGIRAMYEITKQEQTDELTIAAEPNEIPLQQAMLMFDPKFVNPLIQVLTNHIWFIGVNGTPDPFYTSDHPIVKRGHYTDPFQSNDGIASPGIEIALPLTPNYILIMCGRQAFRNYENRENRLLTMSKDHVTYYNGLQIAQCYRQLYSPKDSFALARKMCKDHPEIRDANRKRVEVFVGGHPLPET